MVDSVALPCPSTEKIRDAADEILTFFQNEVSSTKAPSPRHIESFDVYPNPSAGRVTCVLPEGINIKILEAFDLTGRSVPVLWENQSNTFNIQLKSTGIFFLVATDSQGNQYRSRVIIE